MKISKRRLRRIIREEYNRINEGSHDEPMIAKVTALHKAGHGPRAAGEMLSTTWDEMDLQAALDMGKFGPSYLQTYVNEIIDEMNDPTGLHDEPDRGGGSRNRRW